MRTGAERWIGCCGLGMLLAVTGCADKPEEPVDVGVAIGSVFSSNDLPGGTQPGCFAGQFALDSVDM